MIDEISILIVAMHGYFEILTRPKAELKAGYCSANRPSTESSHMAITWLPTVEVPREKRKGQENAECGVRAGEVGMLECWNVGDVGDIGEVGEVGENPLYTPATSDLPTEVLQHTDRAMYFPILYSGRYSVTVGEAGTRTSRRCRVHRMIEVDSQAA